MQDKAERNPLRCEKQIEDVGVIITKKDIIDQEVDQETMVEEEKDLIQTTRIGISKAKNIKWRWYLKNSRSVSKRLKGDRTPKFE